MGAVHNIFFKLTVVLYNQKRRKTMDTKTIKDVVKNRYGSMAKEGGVSTNKGGCGCTPLNTKISKDIGYDSKELKSIPEEANLGLGCGNPLAFASIKEGNTVIDLGSGGGIDCFIASQKVGPGGKVIGIDMTSEMINKARENALKGNYNNVEFIQGEIEELPLDNNTADIITSNCVINLSNEKQKVFNEAFRVLKPGGKIIVSDIILTSKLPQKIIDSIDAYVGCIAGAVLKDEYLNYIEKAGFSNLEIKGESKLSAEYIKGFADEFGITINENTESPVVSIKIEATK